MFAATTLAHAVLAGLLQVNLEQLQESLVDMATSLAPPEIAAIGGGGIASVGLVRWLVNRSASSTTSGGTTTSGQGTTKTTTSRSVSGGPGKHKVAFTLPSILPLSKGIRSVTHNEIHAIELGLVVGAASGWLYDAGYTEPVVGILVIFVTGSLGYRRYSTKAFKTIRLEPWYALLALAGGGVLGWAVFITEPALLPLPSG